MSNALTNRPSSLTMSNESVSVLQVKRSINHFRAISFVQAFVHTAVSRRNIITDCKLMQQNSFIQTISIAPLEVHYYSEALTTQHGYCVGVSRRSAKGNCE